MTIQTWHQESDEQCVQTCACMHAWACALLRIHAGECSVSQLDGFKSGAACSRRVMSSVSQGFKPGASIRRVMHDQEQVHVHACSKKPGAAWALLQESDEYL